jgi:hypothetical protein
MRWKKLRIFSFFIHNACGYTSPPATQEPLLKEKPFMCGANTVKIFGIRLTKSLPLEGKVSTRGSEASDAVDG